MKTIIENGTNISKYMFANSVAITMGADTFDGTTWAANPDWVEPEESDDPE